MTFEIMASDSTTYRKDHDVPDIDAEIAYITKCCNQNLFIQCYDENGRTVYLNASKIVSVREMEYWEAWE